MSKLDVALDAPMEGDPMGWLWSLAAASKRAPKKLPPRFEDATIAGLARAAAALGEPKNGWGIGFARVADVGAQLLVLCPTERLARGVLGLAALSGIGGDVVTRIRRSRAKKPIAAALAEYDRREANATTYAAMRKAMKGYVDEVFPANAGKLARSAKKTAQPLALRLHLVNGRLLATSGRKRKGADERRVVEPGDVTKKEQKQLVGILAKAFGLKETSFVFEDVVSGKSDEELIAETAETPIEWWDVVDDAKKVRYQLWHYHVDCGSLVEAGTTERVASIIQFGFGVEVKDPGHRLARAMEAAHAELKKRCPKSELAGMDFSIDDDE